MGSASRTVDQLKVAGGRVLLQTEAVAEVGTVAQEVHLSVAAVAE